MNRSTLGKAGVPFVLQNVPFTRKEWRGGTPSWNEFTQLVADPQSLYEDGTNLYIVSGWEREDRMRVMASMLQTFGDSENAYYRVNHELKRDDPTVRSDGTYFTQPFKVMMMKVDELEKAFKEIDRDDDRDFDYEMCLPDFFFLTEVGSEIGSSSFTASIIMKLLTTRADAKLPTVVSLAKVIEDIIDRSGNHIYADIKKLIERGAADGTWRKVSLT